MMTQPGAIGIVNNMYNPKNRFYYLLRYLLFVLLYFLNSFIWGYGDAELGIFSTLGGIIMSPMMYAICYVFGMILSFLVNLGYTSQGAKVWLMEWNKSGMLLALIFYDLSILYMSYSLLTGNWQS